MTVYKQPFGGRQEENTRIAPDLVRAGQRQWWRDRLNTKERGRREGSVKDGKGILVCLSGCVVTLIKTEHQEEDKFSSNGHLLVSTC